MLYHQYYNRKPSATKMSEEQNYTDKDAYRHFTCGMVIGLLIGGVAFASVLTGYITEQGRNLLMTPLYSIINITVRSINQSRIRLKYPNPLMRTWFRLMLFPYIASRLFAYSRCPFLRKSDESVDHRKTRIHLIVRCMPSSTLGHYCPRV